MKIYINFRYETLVRFHSHNDIQLVYFFLGFFCCLGGPRVTKFSISSLIEKLPQFSNFYYKYGKFYYKYIKF